MCLKVLAIVKKERYYYEKILVSTISITDIDFKRSRTSIIPPPNLNKVPPAGCVPARCCLVGWTVFFPMIG